MNFTVESDIGLKRTINEDRAAFFERPDHFKLAILADGMGGHNAGDVASEMAITEMHKLFNEVDAEDFASKQLKLDWLRNAVSHINQKIYRYSLTNENCQGMGTTMIAVLLDGNDCTISHVGDSRVYHFKNEAVELVTRDHSYVNILLENGEISEEEAQNHPQRNFILKALGTEISIEPDFYNLTLSNEAYLLICSDGLSNKLSTKEMAQIISMPASIQEKGKKFIQFANDRGGEDNISLILMTTMQEV